MGATPMSFLPWPPDAPPSLPPDDEADASLDNDLAGILAANRAIRIRNAAVEGR